jgi:hypothetical protein
VSIGVDVRVRRIANTGRLNGTSRNQVGRITNRCSTQAAVLDPHKEINHLLVGLGQVVIRTPSSSALFDVSTYLRSLVVPKCDVCVLSMQNLCPNAQTVEKSKARKAAVVKPDSGPKIEIAIEETALALAKVELALPKRGVGPHRPHARARA